MKRTTAIMLLAACMAFGSAFSFSEIRTMDSPVAKQDSTATTKKHMKKSAAKTKTNKNTAKNTSMKKHPKKEMKQKPATEQKSGK